MTYVTDTHALVFFASGKAARMSRKGAQIFRRAERQRDRVHVPVVCFFELAMLLERGRVKSSLSFADWHDRVAQFPAPPIEPLVLDDIHEARGLALLVDPFDRLIAGTAIRLDAPLITGDERIRASGLANPALRSAGRPGANCCNVPMQRLRGSRYEGGGLGGDWLWSVR